MTQRRAQKAVDEIHTELVDSVRHCDTVTGWISVRPTGQGAPSLIADKHLYGGQLGIASFLAGYQAVTGNASNTDLINRVLSPWLNCDVSELTDEAPGGLTGIGSLIYGFELIGQLTEQPKYSRRAIEIAHTVDPHGVQDDEYDIVSGSAGLLAAIQALPNSEIERECITVLGDQLLDAQIETGKGAGGWQTIEEHPTTGFAHGASGIAYALARLYDRTGAPRYKKSVEAALKFEERARRAGEWQIGVHEGLSESRLGWCWGVSGIGLARAAMVDLVPLEQVERDLCVALDMVDTELYPSDCLCHGSMSKVAFFMAAGEFYSEELYNRSFNIINEVMDRRDKNAGYSLVYEDLGPLFRPSLFVGKAGIGYTILRTLYPNKLPAISRLGNINSGV